MAGKAETEHWNIEPEGFAVDLFHTLLSLKQKEFDEFAQRLQESPVGAMALVVTAMEIKSSAFQMLPETSPFSPAARLTADKKVKEEAVSRLKEATERAKKLAEATEKKDTPFKELLHDGALGMMWVNYNSLHSLGAMGPEMFKEAEATRELVERAGPFAIRDTPEMGKAYDWLNRFGATLQNEYKAHEQIGQSNSEEEDGEEGGMPGSVTVVLSPEMRSLGEGRN